MTSETSNAKLFAKIAAVMSECRTLEKTGRNTYDRYDYVTADAIAIKLGAALAKHKVALLPSITSVETAEYTTQKGGSNFRTVVHMQITLACGDSGATWTSLWSGEAIDRSDKSISKAAVSATKYFLLKTFLLAGGDEEDADASSPSVTSDGEPAQTPQTRPEQRNGGTQAQSSTQATKTQQKPATQASEDGGNPFEDEGNGPTDSELEVLGTWRSPDDAKAWAVQVGACSNEHHARESFKNIVDQQGGKLTKENIAAVYLAFLRHQNEKLQKVAA